MDLSFTTSPDLFMLLILVAGMAGFVDAIAGGGGLLTLPVLLWAGLNPVQALATNKAQAVFGSFTASVQFIRTGLVSLKELQFAIILTFLGSALGTLAVQTLDNSFLESFIPVVLLLFAVYFLFSKQIKRRSTEPVIRMEWFALIAGASIGFYDGFFGPGAGTFYTAAFVMLLGLDLRHATAGTKVLNFTSNLASLLFFALGGHVAWVLGISMGIAQIIGAWFGSHLVIRHGSNLIRPLLVLVSMAISLKLLFFSSD